MYKKYLSAAAIIISTTSLIFNYVVYKKLSKIESSLQHQKDNTKKKENHDVLKDFMDKEEETIIKNAEESLYEPTKSNLQILDPSRMYIIEINCSISSDNIIIKRIAIFDPTTGKYPIGDIIYEDPDHQLQSAITRIAQIYKSLPKSICHIIDLGGAAHESNKDMIKILSDAINKSEGVDISSSTFVDNIEELDSSEKEIRGVIFKSNKVSDYMIIKTQSGSTYRFDIIKNLSILDSDYVIEVSRNGFEQLRVLPMYTDTSTNPATIYYKDDAYLDEMLISISTTDLCDIVLQLHTLLPNSIIRIRKNPLGYDLIDTISKKYKSTSTSNWKYSGDDHASYMDISFGNKTFKEKVDPTDSVGKIDYI